MLRRMPVMSSFLHLSVLSIGWLTVLQAPCPSFTACRIQSLSSWSAVYDIGPDCLAWRG